MCQVFTFGANGCALQQHTAKPLTLELKFGQPATKYRCSNPLFQYDDSLRTDSKGIYHCAAYSDKFYYFPRLNSTDINQQGP
jgi:hypothetical protein